MGHSISGTLLLSFKSRVHSSSHMLFCRLHKIPYAYNFSLDFNMYFAGEVELMLHQEGIDLANVEDDTLDSM